MPGTAWGTPSTTWATSPKPPSATSARSACTGNTAPASMKRTPLTRLGDTRHAAGELAQARQAWQQALAILEDIQHPDAGQVRAKLAGTNDRTSPNAPV